MKLTNQTPYPSINFEGQDQLGQSFQVVVLRQTYTWDEQGQLTPAENQDPIKLKDQLVDPKDLMSGIIEEADLAHYKPKCDVIIQGCAYAPAYAIGKTKFTANLTLQKPDTQITKQQDTNKYPFINPNAKNADKTQLDHHKGQTLLNKSLTIHSPRQAVQTEKSITGSLRYQIQQTPFNQYNCQISLNTNSSFGGYCILEETSPALAKLIELNKEALIPIKDRNIYLNPSHGKIAYMAEDAYNPYGTGYLTPEYYQSVEPSKFDLPQIQHPQHDINADIINTMLTKPLVDKTHQALVAGFGIRSKCHPQRNKLLGQVDDEFINSDKLLPNGFNFAVWNCAYPDQQTAFLHGNEVLILTNLCSTQTRAVTKTNSGDTQLALFLPDELLGLCVISERHDLPKIDIPMQLDTLVVSPDEHKVNLVWRAMIVNNFMPKSAVVTALSKEEKHEMIEQDFATIV